MPYDVKKDFEEPLRKTLEDINSVDFDKLIVYKIDNIIEKYEESLRLLRQLKRTFVDRINAKS